MEYEIISERTFETARKKINATKEKVIIFTSADDDLNRKILEKTAINVLLLTQSNRKDFQKQRNSGLNQVLAKIAKKNNIVIGINLDEIITTQGKIKAEILSRVKQNIKLCNKQKLQMAFIGKHKRNLHDLKALGSVLGMPSDMCKQSYL